MAWYPSGRICAQSGTMGANSLDIDVFFDSLHGVPFAHASLSTFTDVAQYRFAVFIVSSSLLKVTAAILLHMKVSVGGY
jgi:hypothetical protein